MTEREPGVALCQDVFGYTPRPEQSTDLLMVPAALIEEAIMSVPDGDGRALLQTVLARAERRAAS